MIELYIDNNRVDLDKEISIEFTYNSLDISNPTAIKNSFSKTVNLPGTANNNKIFGEYWRLDRNIIENENNLIGISFDARKRVPFVLTNSGAIVESGYLQLNTIVRKDEIVQYNITLYGGLGDFFYNLMMNEDGTEKTLADIYYHWKPVMTYDDNKPVFTRDEENTKYVMNWDIHTITRAYENLAKQPVGSLITNDVFITNDILPIPIYNGYYEDFGNDKMIIGDFDNQFALSGFYRGSNGEEVPVLLRTIYNSKLPQSLTEDDKTYTTIADDTISNYKYGMVTVGREMEPYEAQDLRISRMNVGLRLSTFLSRVAEPENNGGYTVNYDEAILKSPYFKYSWIMLDKPDFDESETQYDANAGEIDGNAESWIIWDNQPYDISEFNNAVLELNYQPAGNVKWTFTRAGSADLNKKPRNYYYGTYYNWSGILSVIELYSGDTLFDTYSTLFSLSEPVGLGQDIDGVQIVSATTIQNDIQTKFNSDYSRNITINSIKDGIETTITEDRTTVTSRSGGSQHQITIFTVNGDIDFVYSSTNENLLKVEIPISDTTGITNFRVKISNYKVGYYCNNDGTNGAAYTELSMSNVPSAVTKFLWMRNGLTATSSYSINYLLNPNKFNGVKEVGTEVQSLLRVDKKILFGGSETPFKYLTDFTKILNLKYEYDKINKVINILPAEKYYKNEIIDLSNNIDYSKDITIDPCITDKKYKSFELEVPDTYPNYLYNKRNNIPYGSYRFNTKYEFNNDVENLFSGNIYKELIPYQLNSPFFRTEWEKAGKFGFFGLNDFNWTLWEDGDIEKDQKETLTLTGTTNPNSNYLDRIPKLAGFDKDVKPVQEVKNSFVFLNGFYKNYDYLKIDFLNPSSKYVIWPKTLLSSGFKQMNELNNGNECHLWTFVWEPEPTIPPYGHTPGYWMSARTLYTSAIWNMPYFSKYLYNEYAPHSINGVTQYWWDPSENIYSWSINTPNNIFINNTEVEFITNPNLMPNISDNIPTTFTDVRGNTHDLYYTINPNYFNNENYIYNKFWKNITSDIYDKDGKTVKLTIKLKDIPEIAMKKFYFFEGCIWLIIKIENYNISNNINKFYKVEFIKVKDIYNYLNHNTFFEFIRSRNSVLSQTIDYQSNTYSFEFNTNYSVENITLTNDGSIDFEDYYIYDNKYIYIKVNANTTSRYKSGSIYVNYVIDGENKRIGELSLSQQSSTRYFRFTDSNTNTVNYTVSANTTGGSSIFTTDYTNLTVQTTGLFTAASINGNTLNYTMAANTTSSNRTGTIIIYSDGSQIGVLSLTQQANSYFRFTETGTNTITITPAASATSASVDYETNYTESNLTLQKPTTITNAAILPDYNRIGLSFTANIEDEVISSTIYVKYNGNTVGTIYCNQQAASEAKYFRFPNSSNTITTNVTSDSITSSISFTTNYDTSKLSMSYTFDGGGSINRDNNTITIGYNPNTTTGQITMVINIIYNNTTTVGTWTIIQAATETQQPAENISFTIQNLLDRDITLGFDDTDYSISSNSSIEINTNYTSLNIEDKITEIIYAKNIANANIEVGDAISLTNGNSETIQYKYNGNTKAHTVTMGGSQAGQHTLQYQYPIFEYYSGSMTINNGNTLTITT